MSDQVRESECAFDRRSRSHDPATIIGGIVPARPIQTHVGVMLANGEDVIP